MVELIAQPSLQQLMYSTAMCEAEIRDAVRRSIEAVKSERRPLDFGSVHECSTAHRLALHLETEFAVEWDIDCEYNRSEDEIKRLSLPGSNGENILKNVRPDIAVHRRLLPGPDNNLLIIELKRKTPNDLPDVHDTQKLMSFTEAGGKYEYQYGLQINIQNGLFVCTWFMNGIECGR